MSGGGYSQICDKLAAGQPVILDGGVATELGAYEEPGWGIRALADSPASVTAVHGAYVAAGADVISTDTWGLTGAPGHWMDLGRRGIELARSAGAPAVAFSLNGDSEIDEETVRLLTRMFVDGPPDLLLLETLTYNPDERVVEALLATGLPLWLSFRRCRHGLCGVYGQHWGGPEGDGFGRAARRFEQLGVGALLVNCIPPDHVAGMVSYLRDFVDLPLGVYPNLGYYTDRGWRFDTGVGGAEYAELALRWRAEGAQIVGGCCGVRPEHIAAARERLDGTRAGHVRPEPVVVEDPPAAPWTDVRGRSLYPLPFPRLKVEAGVTAPGPASFMAWRHLFTEGIGAGRRCLDVGSGTGILGIQLARNGADHVHCLDIDERAVANTLANAFRNDVSDRVTAATVDLYPWVPAERYEVIVASLSQRPAFTDGGTHRQADYWGRLLFDQLLGKLPEALAPEGVAFVVQLSILSQEHTAALLSGTGLQARVADFAVVEFPGDYDRSQLEHVEALSDAHHVDAGMVAYLLEIRHV